MLEKSREFRNVYSNALGMSLSDSEARLIFSYCEDISTTDEGTTEVAVVLNLRTAKLLQVMLGDALQHFETVSGQTIPFDSEKYENVRKTALKKQTSSSVS